MCYLDGEKKWNFLYLTHPLQVKWCDGSHIITIVYQHKMASFRVRDSCEFLAWRTVIYTILEGGMQHIKQGVSTRNMPFLLSNSRHEKLSVVFALQTLLQAWISTTCYSARPSRKVKSTEVNHAKSVDQAVQRGGSYLVDPSSSLDDVDMIEIRTVSAYFMDFESLSREDQRAQLVSLSASIVHHTARILSTSRFVPGSAKTWLTFKHSASLAASIMSHHTCRTPYIMAALNTHPQTCYSHHRSKYTAIVVALTQRFLTSCALIECQTELLKIGLHHVALEQFDEEYTKGCAHVVELTRYTSLHLCGEKPSYFSSIANGTSNAIKFNGWDGHEIFRNASKLLLTRIFVIVDTIANGNEENMLLVYEPINKGVEVLTQILVANEWFKLLASEACATSLPLILHCDIHQQYFALVYRINNNQT